MRIYIPEANVCIKDASTKVIKEVCAANPDLNFCPITAEDSTKTEDDNEDEEDNENEDDSEG